MKRILGLAAVAVAFMVLSADKTLGQKVWYSGNVVQTARDLESHTDKYAESLNKSMDASSVDGKRIQDEINGFVDQFEEATDKLEQKIEDQKAAPGLFNEVVNRAKVINGAMVKYKVKGEPKALWSLVKKDINKLGKSYGIVVKI